MTAGERGAPALPRANCREPLRQGRHQRSALRLAQRAPGGDLAAGAPAAEAKIEAVVEHAEFDAGRGDVHGVCLSQPRADEKAAEKADFGELLRRPRDIAGLAANLAARNERDSPGAAERQRQGGQQAAESEAAGRRQ